jgi:ribosomal protein L16 Arg81 hydroxylase
MTAPAEARASLRWLISPVGKEVFFSEYWERQPLVVRRQRPDYYSGLLSLDEVDRVLTTLDLGYPRITLKNAARDVAAADYTIRGDHLDVARVYQLFEEGSTITLAFLDTVVPTLASFCRSLENEFSFPFQTNVYLTPARAQGAAYHYDTHDVFVLQVVNSKRWSIYGTPVESPLAGQEFDSSRHNRGEATLQFELEPGDVAYIPRGIVHEAQSGEDVSLHITAGVLAYTWTDLLLEAVADMCLNDPAFRKSLPPGFARQEFDRSQGTATFRELLCRLSEKQNFASILDRFIDEFVSVCPPLLRGQVAQIPALESLSMESVVGARPGLVFYVRAEGEAVRLEYYGRTIKFPARAGESLRFALNHSKFAVRELPGLDNAGKLTLVRRLIREGLLVSMAHLL